MRAARACSAASFSAAMPTDARAEAWKILRRVDETAAFADALIGSRLPHLQLERRDRALLTQLVYGTLAWRGFLDLAVETFGRRRAASIEAPVRSLLEMSLYQLFFLDKIPAYAAVSRAVELAKTYREGRAARLVNAILRRAAAEGMGAVPLPDRETDPLGYLAARYSHPRWLVERWAAQLGLRETEALLRADNEAAPTVLRVNRRRQSREQQLAALHAQGIEAVAGGLAPEAIAVSGTSAADLPGFAAGDFSLQSESSQLVALLLATAPRQRVLDVCAGGGGKATYVAELMDDRGLVLALDRHRRGLARLRGEARRLGLTCIRAAVADSTRLPFATGESFDRVLVDAPCTGLGTLRQHPEIRWQRRPEDIESIGQVQRRLLASAADLVRPGGMLVYATCTLMPAENEEVVDAVLATRADLERADARDSLPLPLHELVDGSGAMRVMPHRHGSDGFYAAALKRRRAAVMVNAS